MPQDMARYAEPGAVIEHIDGNVLYRSTEKLGPYPKSILTHLDHWADKAGSRGFLAERDEVGGWSVVSYAEARSRVVLLSRYFRSLGLGRGDHLVLIDRNSVLHGLLSLAAMRAGMVVVPVAPNCLDSDLGKRKLRYILGMLGGEPSIYLGGKDAGLRTGGLEDLRSRFLTEEQILRDCDDWNLLDISRDVADDGANAEETVAKILFSSGSTGAPKGVVHTHGMLCAQQQQMAQSWPFVESGELVLCDWLPWNHTSGGNNSFNMTLRNGGCLYIDQGRPTKSGIGSTIRNLKEVNPTWYTNVPLGYASLAAYFEEDEGFARSFLSRLNMMVYGGAPIGADLWRHISDLSVKHTGREAPWGSGWGLTETTSTCCVTRRPTNWPGHVGTPLPGMEFLLRPHEGFFHVHVKGPNVFREYFSHDSEVRIPACREGYFDTGDLVRFLDDEDPNAGLRFVGRMNEQFKSAAGVWVVPGLIKSNLLSHTGALVRDAVIVNGERGGLIALLWINADLPEAKRRPVDDTGADVLLSEIGRVLGEYNGIHHGSSERIAKAVILCNEPDAAAGELTDKGTIVRSTLVENRKRLLQGLSSREIEASVIYENEVLSEVQA